jgi:hypothetical protein
VNLDAVTRTQCLEIISLAGSACRIISRRSREVPDDLQLLTFQHHRRSERVEVEPQVPVAEGILHPVVQVEAIYVDDGSGGIS